MRIFLQKVHCETPFVVSGIGVVMVDFRPPAPYLETKVVDRYRLFAVYFGNSYFRVTITCHEC